MTAQFPALEDTFVRPRSSSPSLERQRLYVDGEIFPALYHYAVRVQLAHYYVETIVSGQHEVDAAQHALSGNPQLQKRAIEVGAVEVIGVNERGIRDEYRLNIRVDQAGEVAIPP